VFEARTKAERDTVTRRLKMVISRLASLAITDNDTALTREFFRTSEEAGDLDSPWAIMQNLPVH
jgi:hypothetical protein